MGNNKIPLQPGNFYHIYNRGINSCPIFKEPTNYQHFLNLYDKYISPVADTFAWVLMGNHFHLAVRILEPENSLTADKVRIEKRINQQFSNLFNAYTKAFNKKYKRTGSLFEHSFERKLVGDTDHLKKLILYIHNNPVHHGFCTHPVEYPWNSYLSYISLQPTKIQRESVKGWFDDEAKFRYWLDGKVEVSEIENWLQIM